MKRKLGWTLGVALVSVASLCSSASADNWFLGGYGGGWLAPNRFYQSDRQIPYFAEFPPVYYSYPVPRTYGYSPYAYPPYIMTPELPPQEIVNPHILPAPDEDPSLPPIPAEQCAAKKQQPKGPLWVVNPFVSGDERVAKLPNK